MLKVKYMEKVECLVNIIDVGYITNLYELDNELNFGPTSEKVNYKVVNISIGEIIATTDSSSNLPKMGYDFIQEFIKSFDVKCIIRKVFVTFVNGEVKLHKNKDVVISRSDKLEYSERDVMMMISYAIANENNTSYRIEKKVSDVLIWFKK